MTLRGADGAFGAVVWSALLGFDLAPRGTPATLAGWRVVVDSGSECILSADGTRMAGMMTCAQQNGWILWTTALRYHGRTGAAVWSVARFAHRQLAPRCLEYASRTLERQMSAMREAAVTSTDLPHRVSLHRPWIGAPFTVVPAGRGRSRRPGRRAGPGRVGRSW